jgi:hypothetical protein
VILNHKGKAGRHKYLMSWVSYNDHEWMPEGNFGNTRDILVAYKKKKKKL